MDLIELTKIARERFGLDEDWHCTFVEYKNNMIYYAVTKKSQHGEWLEETSFIDIIIFDHENVH